MMSLKNGILSGLALLVCGSSAASAQLATNPSLQSNKVMTTIDGSDFHDIVSGLGMNAAAQPYTGDGSVAVTVVTPGGARFFISLFNCGDPVNGKDCQQALLFTGHPNSGVSYDDLNLFNAESDVSKAVNVADSQIVLFGTQMFFRGGVSLDNTKLVMALFLQDMQRYIDRRSQAGIAVSDILKKTAPEKTDNLVSGDASASSSSSQQLRAISLTPERTLDYALQAAISNTLGASFTNDAIDQVISETR